MSLWCLKKKKKLKTEEGEEQEQHGDSGIGARAVSEVEEGAGMSNGHSRSGGFSEYSVEFLLGEHGSGTPESQIHHRASFSSDQPRFPSSITSCPASKYTSLSNSLSLSLIHSFDPHSFYIYLSIYILLGFGSSGGGG